MTSPRYGHPVGTLWQPESVLQNWHEVLVAGAMAADKPATAQAIRVVPTPTVAQHMVAERRYRHDVVAFVELIRDQVHVTRPDLAALIYYGMTSSDIVDNALACRVKDSHRLLRREAIALRRALAKLAQVHQNTYRTAYTHGQQAASTNAGRIWALLAQQVDAAVWTTDSGAELAAVGRFAGPVGDYRGAFPAHTEREAVLSLGLTPTSTLQITPRWRLAVWLAGLEQTMRAVQQVGTLVRFGSIEGVDQIRELRLSGQRGSSSMPHKTNPVRSERLVGLARATVGQLRIVIDSGVEIWPDRDISHSGVERTILPDTIETAAYLLQEATNVVNTILTFTAQTPGLASSADRVREMVDQGVSHTHAYEVVAGTSATSDAPKYEPEREPRLWAEVAKWAEPGVQ